MSYLVGADGSHIPVKLRVHLQVTKRKGEKYQLLWRDTPDFVRMAAKLNAIIVPFAAVGGDDAYDIAFDTDEILNAPVVGQLARAFARRQFPSADAEEVVWPVTKLPGLGLPSVVPIPSVQRLYIR